MKRARSAVPCSEPRVTLQVFKPDEAFFADNAMCIVVWLNLFPTSKEATFSGPRSGGRLNLRHRTGQILIFEQAFELAFLNNVAGLFERKGA